MHPIKQPSNQPLLYEKCSEIILYSFYFCTLFAIVATLDHKVFFAFIIPFVNLFYHQIIPWLLVMLCGYLDPNVRIGDFRSMYQKPEWIQILKNLTLDPYPLTMASGRIGVEFRTFDSLVFGEKNLWKLLGF